MMSLLGFDIQLQKSYQNKTPKIAISPRLRESMSLQNLSLKSNQIQNKQKSKIKLNVKNHKNLQFIPFVHERDSIGRLIQNHYEQNPRININYNQKIIKAENIQKNLNQNNKTQQILNSSRVTQSIAYGNVNNQQQSSQNAILHEKSEKEQKQNQPLNQEQDKNEKININNSCIQKKNPQQQGQQITKRQQKAFNHKSSLSLVDSIPISNNASINISSFSAYNSLKNFKINNIQYKKMKTMDFRKQFQQNDIKKHGLPKSNKQFIFRQKQKDDYDNFLDNIYQTKFRKSISITISKQRQNQQSKLSQFGSYSLNKNRGCSIPSLNCKKCIQNIQKQKNIKKNIKDFAKRSQSLLNMKKGNILDQPVKVKISRQHPQLKRFQQMQRLSIKVIPGYEQDHLNFLNRLKQTKVMAIKIKNSLQLQ